MNTKSVDQLKLSAETNNIDLLYEVIQDDPSILEIIDKKQFVDTPLHIAASRGHLKFATEIMNLKPSLAMKLNMQGYSPIHLAMNNLPIHPAEDNPQRVMVLKLVGINKDLVRVKGREGLTPLHIACQNGEVELLAEFLNACPDSIEDENVTGESALHIAVINHQFKALQVLVGWLKENCKTGARKLQNKIFNHKDDEGNTALHIAALSSKSEVVHFLVKKTGIKLNAKNLKSKTALDLATPENKKILICANAKPGSQITKAMTLAEHLRFIATIIDIQTWISRLRSDITEEQRNTWLIVATLVATVTFESALNPPGGVFQVSASDDNNMKIKSRDEIFSTRGNAGKSILSKESFMLFSIMNMLSFFGSITAILFLTPWGAVGLLVILPVSLFIGCYLFALPSISPTHATSIILCIPYSLLFMLYVYLIFIIYTHIVLKKRYMTSTTQTDVARTAVARV